MVSEAFNEQLELLKEVLADEYAVERELGAGGMGAVYLARDLKHDRAVAIKVLHPEFAQSIGADRFLREVQVTAKLSHPHILPLYDSGNADGVLYYVMPLVEGESLADRMLRLKQLPIKDAVSITKEVAGALAYAHSLGLVHRDIKPGNIMLTGGHAIVVDFGIARAADAAGGEKLTQTGMSVGTPAYMSPEQATGDQVDGRSDLYSLGCVLYEMLVGQVPFTGPTPMAIMARHTMDNVPPPTIMREAIPDELEDIIMTAMAKTAADRYQTGVEMVEALDMVDVHTAMHRRPSIAERRSAAMLRTAGITTPRTPQPSVSVPHPKPAWRRAVVPAGVAALAVAGVISWNLLSGSAGAEIETLDARRLAVLYFDDLSAGDTLEFLADGLTDALIERLASVPRLTVLSRNAVAPFRDANLGRDSIARVLEVGTLVSGSVEPVADRVRVTVRLVEGFTGTDIDRATVELPAGNLLAVRDSAAELVEGFLRERLGEEMHLRERRAGTRNATAWSLVRRAEQLRNDGRRLESEDAGAALRTYQTADSLLSLAEQGDPAWVDPIVLRGWLSYDESFLAHEAHAVAGKFQEAIALADRALRVSPGDAEAHHLRGRSRYQLYRRQLVSDPEQRRALLAGARADLEAAVAADPGLANAWYALSNLAYDEKDKTAALIAAERAYEADAFLANQDRNVSQLFQTHYDSEQWDKAERWCNVGARRFPHNYLFVRCQLFMLLTPYRDADVAAAWRLAAAIDTLVPEQSRPLLSRAARMYVGGVIARAGDPDSARHVLVAARAGPDVDEHYELALDEAAMRAFLGDYDEAVDLLGRYVVANHKLDLQELSWWLRPLKGQPGFNNLTSERR